MRLGLPFSGAFGYKRGQHVGPAPGAARNSLKYLEYYMAVPRKKTTPMKRGQRRSGHRKETVTYVENKQTGELHRPHHIDLKTGLYRGKQILQPKSDF